MKLSDLLKYIGIPKVISVPKERTYKAFNPGYAAIPIHPVGAERIVEKYLLFPRNIGGRRVRGHQRILQVCGHDYMGGPLPHEVWDDVCIEDRFNEGPLKTKVTS